MNMNEFAGAAVVACGIAIMVGLVMAVIEYRERESLAQQLEEWQQKEWIDNLVDMRRAEFKQTLK